MYRSCSSAGPCATHPASCLEPSWSDAISRTSSRRWPSRQGQALPSMISLMAACLASSLEPQDPVTLALPLEMIDRSMAPGTEGDPIRSISVSGIDYTEVLTAFVARHGTEPLGVLGIALPQLSLAGRSIPGSVAGDHLWRGCAGAGRGRRSDHLEQHHTADHRHCRCLGTGGARQPGDTSGRPRHRRSRRPGSYVQPDGGRLAPANDGGDPIRGGARAGCEARRAVERELEAGDADAGGGPATGHDPGASNCAASGAWTKTPRSSCESWRPA